jgi:hypothetical protein
MTKLLDLVRDCRRRQVEDEDEVTIFKIGNHEFRVRKKDGKYWSDGHWWTFEELVIESMKLHDNAQEAENGAHRE